MASAPAGMWVLACPWCAFELHVFPRGGPYGAGEEAADRMRDHVESAHERTWREFLAATRDDA